ncbi:hypothetical protein CCACVL1_23733, partial [Corchorus capsularis]
MKIELMQQKKVQDFSIPYKKSFKRKMK